MNKRKKVLAVSLVITGLIVIGNLSVPQQWRAESSLPDPQQIELLEKFDIKTVIAIKRRYVWWLFLIPGVNAVGVGRCDERFCISIGLKRETIAARTLIPKTIKGVPVRWEVRGEIVPL